MITIGHYSSRLRIPLRTRNLEEARKRRDIAYDALQKAARAFDGFSVD